MSVPEIRFASTHGRWVLAAAILGSGIAFLDSSVVNTALPSIKREFNASLAGQQLNQAYFGASTGRSPTLYLLPKCKFECGRMESS